MSKVVSLPFYSGSEVVAEIGFEVDDDFDLPEGLTANRVGTDLWPRSWLPFRPAMAYPWGLAASGQIFIDPPHCEYSQDKVRVPVSYRITDERLANRWAEYLPAESDMRPRDYDANVRHFEPVYGFKKKIT